MKIVILDTDFIINCIKNHIDIETSIKEISTEKIEISYLDKTLKELGDKPFENIARSLTKNFKKISTRENKNVDDLIVDMSKTQKNIVVATQDKKLKERLKKGKISVITIRQNKNIVFA